MAAKADLRKKMRALRDGIPAPEHLMKSAAIRARLLKVCVDRHLTRVGLFSPFRGEPDLMPALEARKDWLWFFPRVITDQPPRLAWGAAPLEPGRHGILEPALAEHLLPPVQLLLVPCLAFDGDGYRLGYGGGFYDALLDRLPDGILTLAVAFGCQEVADLPREPRDLPVQGVLTEAGLRWFDGD
ncbi:MAG TPA: 5-formyltetrahydrofolate cyclo-ligase [Holophagaceae bacterium]|nr:5-formyltetrahydrofolate cyclo-ligase [Holophagaceae bacterium]